MLCVRKTRSLLVLWKASLCMCPCKFAAKSWGQKADAAAHFSVENRTAFSAFLVTFFIVAKKWTCRKPSDDLTQSGDVVFNCLWVVWEPRRLSVTCSNCSGLPFRGLLQLTCVKLSSCRLGRQQTLPRHLQPWLLAWEPTPHSATAFGPAKQCIFHVLFNERSVTVFDEKRKTLVSLSWEDGFRPLIWKVSFGSEGVRNSNKEVFFFLEIYIVLLIRILMEGIWHHGYSEDWA